MHRWLRNHRWQAAGKLAGICLNGVRLAGMWLLCMVLAGCEDIPQLPKVANTKPIPENAITNAGRGDYDWFMVNGKFEVRAQSDLEVLRRIDQELVRKNLPIAPFVERAEPLRPEGMDDDVYYIFRRYTEPYFDTKPFLTIPFTPKSEGLYSVNSAGDRLVVLGQDLEVWDLETGKRLTAVAAPSSKCTRVLWDFSPEQVVVMDNTSVYRIVAATGQVLDSWSPPQSDEPAVLVRAANAPTYAVSTTQKKLYALGKDLKATHEFKGQLDNPSIAIRPDAKWVLAMSSGSAVRWHISSSRQDVQTLGGLGNQVKLIPLSGNNVDYLVGPQMQAICFNDRETQQLRLLNCDVNPLTHAGAEGTMDGETEWFTGCLSRPAEGGKRQYFIQDLVPETGDFSVEFPLGNEPVLELSIDQSAEVCAVRDARQLSVYRRQCWKDFTGAWTRDHLSLLAGDGRYEQLELAANALRKQARLRNSHGEGFYSVLAATVGEKWAQLEIDEAQRLASVKSGNGNGNFEDRSSILKSLDEWSATGGEFANLASGYRHLEIGRRARGGGYANSVTRSKWDEYEQRNQKILQAVEPLLNGNVKSLGALRLAIASRLNSGQSPEELQPLMKELLESFPYATFSHIDICIHMLPRWGGNAGDGGAYLSSISELLPRPHGDLLYTRVAIGVAQLYQPTILSAEESGISMPRVLRSIDEILELNQLNVNEVEFLIKLAKLANRMDLVEKLARYHVRNFALTRFEPDDYVKTLLGNARLEMAK